MNPYSRQYLRERYLAEQQTQLAKDAQLSDPAQAYLTLLEQLRVEFETRDEAKSKAA